MLLLLSVLVTLLYLKPSLCAFSCKDQNGHDVDWYIALKMPKKSESKPLGISTGHGFYYLDYNNKNFVESSVPLNFTHQAIAYTVQQVYDNLQNPDAFYMMYNDEEASTAAKSSISNASLNVSLATVQYGHLKGVLLFDKTQGFWLIHSVPQFPPPNKYGYPNSGTTYGQNFLCMTFKYAQLTKIGTQLYYNHPLTYLSQLPTDIASQIPDLAKAVRGLYKSGSEKTNVESLATVKGITFVSFAKTHQFAADLYSSLVADYLKTGLYVESWKRGLEVPLVCPPPKYPVYDIQYLKTSQYVRGGGTVCFKDEFVWNEYVSFIVEKNGC